MRKRLLVPAVALFWCSSALAGRPRDPSVEEYERARHSYFALKDDAQQRKFRHNWLNVVHKFEAVAQKHPKSERAAKALYTSADLLAELSRISMLDEDLQHAIADYEKLVGNYPKDPLADDAAEALARIHLDRTGKVDLARRVINKALEDQPRGDMRKKLLVLRSQLPAQPERPATGTRIAAKRSSEVRVEKEPVPAPVPAPAPAVTKEKEVGRGAILQAIARASTDSKEKVAEPQAPTEPVATASAEPTPKADPKVEEKPQARAEAKVDSRAEAKVDPRAAKEKLNAAVKPSGDGITLAEQLGLKVRRVVIDAGHGGHDTGAIGKKGTTEKEVTLAISRRVAELLSERGLEVVLTRDHDTFVRLEDRARIANEQKGDLFISIHCNAAESRKLRGIETYSLNVASDRYSIRLAARENASSEKSISDLQFILADLATRANTDESQRLASRVQKNLVKDLSHRYEEIKDLGTKEALFYVLLGAKMPAILVETAFLSNPDEEKRLNAKSYREDVAKAIASGVEGYLQDRQRVAQVD